MPTRKRRKQNGPHKVGPYVVERELARGGMGVVYLARDPRLDRSVAIKVLPDEFAADEELLVRFEREAKILASLNHPNIAAIYELEQVAGAHFLILEFVTGETLKERLSAGAMSLDEALSACSQIARAIEAAHERGVIHRDLKPANVKITPEGIVKVLDFGVAKTTRATEISGEWVSEVTTLDGTGSSSELLGTPGYMSPEQIEGLTVDRRADIWAFGCVLFECLTGTAMFKGRTAFDRFRATLEEEPDWAALPPDLPDSLDRLLRRCLQKDPAARLRDIADARLELEETRSDRSGPRRRATATPRHNLPRPLTSFIGRKRQIDAVTKLLSSTRLVTLTGMGGCGKTRLALEVASAVSADQPDGTWLVELAPITDPSLLGHEIAAALNVREEPGRPLAETLGEFLRDRSLLLVLDNCEHLLRETGELLVQLLRSATALKVLASSREALGIDGEHTYPVPPLELPAAGTNDPRELESYEAPRLLLERALLCRPAFAITDGNAAAVAEICRSLDGIPLAIELAAAWSKILSMEDIAARLSDRFRLLKSGNRNADARHQTLRATIDWSYEHLDDAEATLFRRLGVFASGWTLEAAETVCAGDGLETHDLLQLLTHLVDKSLVVVEKGEGRRRRYRLLGTVHQYVQEKLAEDHSRAGLRARHVDYYLELAEAAGPQLLGANQVEWLDRLEADHDNIRTAIEACRDQDGYSGKGLRFGAALWPFWDKRGYWAEGRRHLSEFLDTEPARERTSPRARALDGLGFLSCRQGEYGPARAACEESLEISRELDDPGGVASALEHLGYVALDLGDYEMARQLYEESLTSRRQLRDNSGIARALNSLGLIADALGDYDTAGPLLEESLTVARELGDRFGIAVGLNNLGLVAKRQGDYSLAKKLCAEALEISRALGNRMAEAVNLENLGEIAERQGDLDIARTIRLESLGMFETLGDKSGVARNLIGFAILEVSRGEHDRAAHMLGAAEAHCEAFGFQLGPADRAEHDPAVDATRAALGDDRFQAAWGTGRAMSLTDAIRYAIGEPA